MTLRLSLVWLLVTLIAVTSAEKTLCKDTHIHSADRLSNNTYRVYRGEYYWELVGLPERVATVIGPYPVWWPNMLNITRDTAISTIVSSSSTNGFTFKFKGIRLWTWNKNGVQRAGGQAGVKWNGFPQNTGFTAVYNDGDLDKKGYPMFVAFSNIKVYYYRSDSERLKLIGSIDGHINGQFDEKFPSDVTAVMAFPSQDPDVKYYVYLFKRKEYCFRPVIGEKDCKEWRKNSELFGCDSADAEDPVDVITSKINGSDSNPNEPTVPVILDQGNENPNPTPTNNACSTDYQLIHGLISIVFIVIFLRI